MLFLALQETKIASNDERISPEVLNIKSHLKIMEVEPVLDRFTLSNAFEKKIKVSLKNCKMSILTCSFLACFQ